MDATSNGEQAAVPVRACCGRRHWTVECPDGLVMCCLCFRRVQVDDLNVVGGHPEDVCKPCAEDEARAIAAKAAYNARSQP